MRRSAVLVAVLALLMSAACARAPAAEPATAATPAPVTSAAPAPITSVSTAVPATTAPAAPAVNGPCPTVPIKVIAVENFYGNILSQLGGQCVKVTSILTNPDTDPHEYQPTASDARSYQTAQLVVENGLGYDDFSDKIISTLGQKPLVLNIGEMLELKDGDNPHVWYSPEYVNKIAAAMTQSLKKLDPTAASYFDNQSSDFLNNGLKAYRASVTQIQTQFKGTPIASTESIFVYMAQGTGLNVISPAPFMNAVSEGNDPAARDVATFQDQVTKRQVKVLVNNTQNSTTMSERLKEMAAANSIPVVGVTETIPPDAKSFQDWQTGQLQQLIKALESTKG